MTIEARYAPKALKTGNRLGLALLAYMLGVTLIITLLPFQFEWPAQWRIASIIDPVDMIANVLLFVPLGFFYRLARSAYRCSALQVLVLGALASTAIESAQLFEIARVPSWVDVAANTTGAWLGALALGRVASSPKVNGRLVGWLALELPIMGLVYLMVPLLWVNSLSSGGDVVRDAGALLLGIVGAMLLGGMQRHYFGPAGASGARKTAVFAALWFAAGASPSLPSRPLEVMLGTAVVCVVAYLQGRRTLRGTEYNRRFEAPLLKSTAPAYAAYLMLITIAPLLGGMGAWSVRLAFPGDVIVDRIEILRLLELVAAFTLSGYMAAEFGGRVVLRYRDALARLTRWGIGLACIVEIVRGYHEGYGASLVHGAMLAAAALYGGWLYYLQRAHVVRLLSSNRR
jgi:VanZ family protein